MSHDFAPNPTYEEAKGLGQELKRLTHQLTGLQKQNRIALVADTEALNALKWFPTDKDLSYNDVVHWLYGALYELNLECDVISAKETDWSRYDLLVFPSLYCVPEDMAERMRGFVERGGTVFAAFRSFVADENIKIFHDSQPHGLTDCFGMTYNQHTRPVNVTVAGAEARYWMELLTPTTAETVACYEHKYWGKYAAITRNAFGKGYAWYLGTMLPPERLQEYLLAAAADAGIIPPAVQPPMIVRSAVNAAGDRLHFFLNYSSEPISVPSPWRGIDLLTGKQYETGSLIELDDWGVCILREKI